MQPDTSFWQSIAQLLLTNPIIIDRPNGTSHPYYREMSYPLDYGYLENTTSSAGGGIDVWPGSLNMVIDNQRARTLTGILCTFDTLTKCRMNYYTGIHRQIISGDPELIVKRQTRFSDQITDWM